LLIGASDSGETERERGKIIPQSPSQQQSQQVAVLFQVAALAVGGVTETAAAVNKQETRIKS
jgi:hypothetical protein